MEESEVYSVVEGVRVGVQSPVLGRVHSVGIECRR